MSRGQALSAAAIAGHWRTALGEVVRDWRSLALFQVWYGLLVSALAGSAAGWLLDRLVRTTGSAAVTNFDLAGFFLSPWGLAFIALMVATGSAFLLAERCGVLLLVAANPSAPLAATDALRLSLLHSPRLAWLGWWYALVFAAALLPFALAHRLWGQRLRPSPCVASSLPWLAAAPSARAPARARIPAPRLWPARPWAPLPAAPPTPPFSPRRPSFGGCAR